MLLGYKRGSKLLPSPAILRHEIIRPVMRYFVVENVALYIRLVVEEFI